MMTLTARIITTRLTMTTAVVVAGLVVSACGSASAASPSEVLASSEWYLTALRTTTTAGGSGGGGGGGALVPLNSVADDDGGGGDVKLQSMFDFRDEDYYRADDGSGWMLKTSFFPCTDLMEWYYSVDQESSTGTGTGTGTGGSGQLRIQDTSSVCPGCTTPEESATMCWGVATESEEKAIATSWTMEFINAVRNVAAYRFQQDAGTNSDSNSDSNRLVLVDETDTVLLELVSCSDMPLSGTDWEVTTIHDPDDSATVLDVSVPGYGLTVRFNKCQISGNAGCNGYQGAYSTAQHPNIFISGVGVTEMWCESEDGSIDLMGAEAAFSRALGNVVAYRTVFLTTGLGSNNKEVLWLLDGNGDTVLELAKIDPPQQGGNTDPTYDPNDPVVVSNNDQNSTVPSAAPRVVMLSTMASAMCVMLAAAL